MKLTATKRVVLGKKVKTLRKAGQVPAVIFGKGEESLPIAVNLKEFQKVYKEAGEATLVDVEVEKGEARKVLITGVDRDPLSDEIIHADLHAVKLTEKITAKVPLAIVGESLIVKGGKAILLELLPEIEVECLPTDLPTKIEVNVSLLTEIGQGVRVSDLNLNREKIAIKHNPEEWIVRTDYAEMKEELAEEAPATKVIGEEEKKAEEAAKAEGAPQEQPQKQPEEKKPEAKKE